MIETRFRAAAPVQGSIGLRTGEIARVRRIDPGSPGIRWSGNGVREISARWEIKLPPSGEAGRQGEEILFEGPDGIPRPYRLAWDVIPWIRASPSGLLISTSAPRAELTVMVMSVDRPFRVVDLIGLDSIRLESKHQEAQTRHQVRLSLACSEIENGRSRDLHVITDDPRQPRVTISVIGVQGPAEGRRKSGTVGRA